MKIIQILKIITILNIIKIIKYFFLAVTDLKQSVSILFFRIVMRASIIFVDKQGVEGLAKYIDNNK